MRLAVRYNDRELVPVLPETWLSGSDNQFINVGDTITRIEGGLFGQSARYTAVAVEVEPTCDGHRPLPVFVVVNEDNITLRLRHGDRLSVQSSNPERAGQSRDGWAEWAPAEIIQ